MKFQEILYVVGTLLVLPSLSFFFLNGLKHFRKVNYEKTKYFYGEQGLKAILAVEVGLTGFALSLGIVSVFYDEIIQRALYTFIINVASSSTLSRSAFVCLAILLSGFLFFLRKKARIAYGALEVTFGGIGLIAYPVVPKATSISDTAAAAWLLGLMSLIYIIIRGLDNMDIGISARRKRIHDQ